MKWKVPEQLEPIWERFCAGGFFKESHAAGDYYPMPGDLAFDDDDAFLQLPLFPADQSTMPVKVRDERWELPLSWMRQYETRPRSHRTLLLGREVKNGQTEVERAAALFIRRAAYLELFRPRKPYALPTLQNNVRFYRAVADYAISTNVMVSELGYHDLLDLISTIPKVIRRRVPMAHEMMRWWRGRAPEKFFGYIPPPRVSSTSSYRKPVSALTRSGGFDPKHIRDEDGQDCKPDQKFQPLPDDFVAKMGEFMIWVNTELRPLHLKFIKNIECFSPEPTQEQIKDGANALEWPEGFEVVNKTSAIRIANLCQSAGIFLVSLLLGPRWSEVSAIPRNCLRKMSDGSFVLDGSTFKYSQNLSGEMRDWPIHPELARALVQQQEYIELTEGSDFPFLWRSHSSIFESGEPVRQSGGLLKRMMRNADCAELLAGSSFHHHRFRKTTARLIVIALHGGPLVLRRLFGHQHLGVTLRYILANTSIVEELREIAEEEQRAVAAKFLDTRSELRGGGADSFNKSIDRIQSLPNIFVPAARRDQNAVTTEDILKILADESAEGLSLKQIVPGLIVCFKPSQEAGLCCKLGELPNVARCSIDCKWHLEMPEYLDEARKQLQSALLALCVVPPNSLKWEFYSEIAQKKLLSFPELKIEFADDPLVRQLIENSE